MDRGNMVPKVVPLLLAQVLVKLAIGLTDAQAIIFEDQCADPNGTVTLSCRGHFHIDTQENLHLFRSDWGKWIPIDNGNNPAKYEVINNSTINRTEADGRTFLIKKLELKVKQVTASDAVEYGCGTREVDIRVAYLRVSNHTDFRLSTTEETLIRGQNLMIQATADCKLSGTLRAVKKDSGGTSTAVPYGPRSMEPYIGRKDGDFVIPHFRCQLDAGEYEFTYTTADGRQPIEEKLTVHIKAAGENCSVPKQPTTPRPAQKTTQLNASKGMDIANVGNETNGNSTVAVLAVLFVLATVVCIILAVAVCKLWREISRLKGRSVVAQGEEG